jgi:hypothetical protein
MALVPFSVTEAPGRAVAAAAAIQLELTAATGHHRAVEAAFDSARAEQVWRELANLIQTLG